MRQISTKTTREFSTGQTLYFILLRASTKTGWCMECVCVFVFVTVVDIICVCYVVAIYH